MQDDIELLSEAQAAELLGVSAARLHQLVRDGALVGLPTGHTVQIPADQVQDGKIVKHLGAVITQLRDVRYSDAEILDWLYRDDDSLPGSPIQALRENRGSEVKRRAQVAGY